MNLIQSATILAVDDDPFVLLLLQECLSHVCLELLVENEPEAVVPLAEKEQPDLILLDIMMGDADGYAICRELKQNSHTTHIPIIFLSALMRASDKVKGFEAGGVDYIAKPFHVEEMLARIESCLKVHQQIQQSQSNYDDNDKIVDELDGKKITKREFNILQLYVLGYKRSEIATKLFISENTIKWHLKNIFAKLGVKSRAEAIEKARQHDLVKISTIKKK